MWRGRRGAGAAHEVVERRVLRGHAGAASVAGRRAQLQLELVGGLEAAVGRQQRVARGLAGVVDERVQLSHTPAEQQRSAEWGIGRGRHVTTERRTLGLIRR
jgi:hypothetical protein